METFLNSKPLITNPENLLHLMQDTIFLLLDESSPLVTGWNTFFLKSCLLAFPCFLVLLIFLLAPQFLFHDVGQKTDFLTQDFHGGVLLDHFLPTKSSIAFPSIRTLHIHLSTPDGLAWGSSVLEGDAQLRHVQLRHCEHPWLARERKTLLRTINLTFLL